MEQLDLVELLKRHREDIVARFVREVQRKDLPPAGLPRSLLVDHIPQFLDEIIQELTVPKDVRFSHDANDESPTAREHGDQRWRLGYDLESLVREYGILRHCILSAASEVGASVSINEFDVLAKCLNVGVSEAAAAYTAHRDEEHRAQHRKLEFLAESGQLLSSSLDYRSTLSRLMALLVPQLADWCVLQLSGSTAEELAIAHVNPDKVEVLREIYRRYERSQDGSKIWQQVMKTGEPQLVANIDPTQTAAAQDPEHLAMIRDIATCSYIVVPLRVQGSLFGTLSLCYSDSRRHYTPEDLELALELARSASVAIDNARLYELSQHERSRAEAATRAKDELVAVVSHELRTPLNAILGWVRLVREGSLSEAKRAQALETIERNANAQALLIEDLLDVSRVMTGQVRINLGIVDFASVVAAALDAVRPSAEAKGIRLDFHVEATDTAVRADGERLQQVVLNLLANAVKFSPQDAGVVQARLRQVGADLELEVADNGLGIAPEFLPHIFESFRQYDTGPSRRHGGLGVGLSTSKHLVELHGGVIEARSEGQGRGSTMLVRLPIGSRTSAESAPTKATTTAPVASAAARPTDLKGLKVLVVDDDDDARELVSFVLEGAGMSVRQAANVREALLELAHAPVQVVVSDIGMPGEDGFALIRSIRTLPTELRDVPAIALTAFASHDERTRALVAGFSRHIAKPAEPGALLAAIAELVGGGARE